LEGVWKTLSGALGVFFMLSARRLVARSVATPCEKFPGIEEH